MFLIVSLFDKISEKLSEVIVANQVALFTLLVTDRTFMLPVHNLVYAVFAESVSTLCYVGVIECLEADNTLCILTNYFVYTDPNRFVKS